MIKKQLNINAPTVLTIFGATGDLMKRKLTPAIYDLWRGGNLPDRTKIIGIARTDITEAQFKKQIAQSTKGLPKVSKARMNSFLKLFSYHNHNFLDQQTYKDLASALKGIDGDWGMCSNKLFYLAVPPKFYKDLFVRLAKVKLNKPCSDHLGWTRILVEKPFGEDVVTARKLDKLLASLFKERQIFRIDHYLAKEAVQNILALRFSNTVFEAAWNNKSIEGVEIKLLEKIGVGKRAVFYEGVGALRDVGQNHILQMLALIAMDRPKEFDAEHIRGEKEKVLAKLEQIPSAKINTRTTRAQYKGYLKEEGVSKKSKTETYFKLMTFIDSTRWQGVPFFIESGKGLDKAAVSIKITFKHHDPCICPDEQHYQNIFSFNIQPDHKISIKFYAKVPGSEMVIKEELLEFDYYESFKGERFIDAYEKILLDTINGDQTLFTRGGEIEAGWKFVDNIVKGWKKNNTPLLKYKKGSSGPKLKK